MEWCRKIPRQFSSGPPGPGESYCFGIPAQMLVATLQSMKDHICYMRTVWRKCHSHKFTHDMSYCLPFQRKAGYMLVALVPVILGNSQRQIGDAKNAYERCRKSIVDLHKNSQWYGKRIVEMRTIQFWKCFFGSLKGQQLHYKPMTPHNGTGGI